jgi:ABC-type branched-subunit amino acid transport system ATPase component
MILELRDVARHYGGVRAVDGVSCGVEQGSITALIGPNGAGKTTLLNLASGVTPPSAGTVFLGGTDVTGQRSHQLCHAGIARTFQTPQLFPGMSVLENVLVGATPRGHISLLGAALHLARSSREEAAFRREALELIAQLDLPAVAQARVGDLAFGVQRRVEIARGLASQPRLFMLDEPASGLSRAETAELATIVRSIAARGITVLLVEHNMRFVMSLATRVLVLDKGKLLANGTPAEVQANRDVQRAYLGT